MKLTIRQKLLLFSIVILAGIGYAGYGVYNSNQRQIESAKWVQQTEEVISESGHVLSLAKDIESGSRGFVVTRDSSYLIPLQTAEKTIAAHIERLKKLTGYNPVQEERIDSLHTYINLRLAFSRQTVDIRASDGLEAAIAFVRSGTGKEYSDQIRQVTSEIQQEANVQLKKQQQASAESTASFNLVLAVIFIVMAGCIIVLFYTVTNYLLELKKYEDELSAANDKLQQFRHFFIHNNDFACIANMEGYFEVTNPPFEQILGYSEPELTGQPFLNFIHPEDVSATLQEVEKLKTGAPAVNFTNRYRKKSGEYLWLEWNSTPNPSTGKLYAIARDITERRKSEEQLQSLNKELEAFSYSVSHDLRAPLRAVHGYAQILKEDFGTQLTEEGNRVINNIMANAKKMGQLIDDLLTFSRLSRKELQKSNIAMREMVDSLCRELNVEHDHHQVQYLIKDLFPVKADSVTIKQVWTNLLSNAVKYSRKKGKSIIEIGSEENEHEVTYYVKDNGAGFDMRYADKLFGVFQRLHSETEFEGTGVGLAIVQRIIARHGGRVWAEGIVNEGATFYFTLNKS